MNRKSKVRVLRTLINYSLVGGLVGYIILHPFAMVVAHCHSNDFYLLALLLKSFGMAHLSMAAYFSLLGMLFGCIFGMQVLRITGLLEEARAIAVEKSLLMQEMSHRAKNNFALIIGMLDLQSLNSVEDETAQALDAAISRLHVMVDAHAVLYRSSEYESIQMAVFLRKVIEGNRLHKNILIELELSELELPTKKAVACGLLVNELLTNSLKHAFPDDFAGSRQIGVDLRHDDPDCLLTVRDNGIGIKEGNPRSMGLELVESFVEQLEGTMRIDGSDGTVVAIRFNGFTQLEERQHKQTADSSR